MREGGGREGVRETDAVEGGREEGGSEEGRMLLPHYKVILVQGSVPLVYTWR